MFAHSGGSLGNQYLWPERVTSMFKQSNTAVGFGLLDRQWSLLWLLVPVGIIHHLSFSM